MPARRALALLLALAFLAGCSGSTAPGRGGGGASEGSTATPGPSPYVAAPFTAEPAPHRFGQDPSYTADGRVLSNAVGPDGVEQVYVSQLDGSDGRCLTCGQPGPNGYPLERPQGDWILFCSWRGSAANLGKPCLGGYGTDLYLMRPDGSEVTRLTEPGTPFEAGGVYDNYHPAWSPDGARISWTHVDFRARADGGAQWQVVVADVDLTGDRPALGTPRVIAPAVNAAYETQCWAPDGKSLLYTRFGGADPTEGWMSSQLQRAWIGGDGASIDHPRIEQLTDGSPAWNEQAVFTPDGRAVVFMSSRGTPTWYQALVTVAQEQGYFPPEQNTAFGALFLDTIADPRFRTDLYLLDLDTRSIRRLTDLDSVIPEFTFDATGTHLLWSEGNRKRRTMLGTFDLAATPATFPKPAVDERWAGAPKDGPVVEVPEPPTAQAPSLTTTAVPDEVVEGATLFGDQLAAMEPFAASLAHGPNG